MFQTTYQRWAWNEVPPSRMESHSMTQFRPNWDHCTTIPGKLTSIQYNFCSTIIRGTRLEHFVYHIIGQHDKVIRCNLVPREIKIQYQMTLHYMRERHRENITKDDFTYVVGMGAFATKLSLRLTIWFQHPHICMTIYLFKKNPPDACISMQGFRHFFQCSLSTEC